MKKFKEKAREIQGVKGGNNYFFSLIVTFLNNYGKKLSVGKNRNILTMKVKINQIRIIGP
jgi:hypothetical protein